jgi:SAM-dependent methyltransferase
MSDSAEPGQIAPTTSPSRAGLFGEDYFAINYKDYDRQNPVHKLEHYRRAVERHWSPATPRRLYDIGCAYGRFVAHLGSSWDARGSDISRHAIGRARARYGPSRYEVVDATRDRPRDGGYGAVTCFDTMEHVPDCDAIGELARQLLVPGGVFVFVVPAYDGATAPLHRWLDRDPTHVHKWPRRAWLDWAARRFRVLEWHGILRYLLPGGHYLHLTTRRLREETPAILVACRRA